jgi:DNA-binding response OmpR family regulator
MITPEQIFEGKILLIDDEPANVMLLEQTLRQGGYSSIKTITDPSEALETYKNFNPDLVLLDLNMPKMNGFQVMEQIKESDPNTKVSIMILTAQIDHGTRLRALDAGARDFLTKPFDILEVLLRIKNMMEISLLYRQAQKHYTSLDKKYMQSQAELFTIKSKLKEMVNQKKELEIS